MGIDWEINTEKIDIENIIRNAEMGIVSFCTFAVIFLAMQTYSPKLESGAIVLDITKSVSRVDYYLGKLIANLIVAALSAGGIVLFSIFLIYRQGPINILLMKGFFRLVTPLFILSLVSIINLYLPPKATGISGFILYIVYVYVRDYLMDSQIDSQISIMGIYVSLVPIGILLLSAALIVIGISLFNHKEL
jgi:hypothetical protein